MASNNGRCRINLLSGGVYNILGRVRHFLMEYLMRWYEVFIMRVENYVGI
jgi:hypothetical protein